MLFNLFLSAMLLALVLSAVSNGRYGKAVGVSLLAAGACFLCMAPAVLLHALLLAGALFVGELIQAGRRGLVCASVMATLAAYAIAGIPGILNYRHMEQERAEHPMESLADRLAYESQADRPASVPPREKAETWASVAKLENDIGQGMTRRIANLKRIHRDVVAAFVKSESFGVGRMLDQDFADRVGINFLEQEPGPAAAPCIGVGCSILSTGQGLALCVIGSAWPASTRISSARCQRRESRACSWSAS